MSSDKKILGIITARGGSKRIPKKSIVSVLGRPTMAYVCDAFKKSKLVNRFIVDTDDEEMAEVGRQNGAEVAYMRPKELAQDGTGHVPVLKNALETLKKIDGYWPDVVVLVQPTSSLVQPEHIDQTVELILKEDLDSVEAVFEVPTIFHPYNERYIDENGFTKFLMPKERAEAAKTGKRPKIYAIGTVYTFKPDILWQYNTIQGEKSKSIIIDKKYAVDIDEPLDVATAEAMLKWINK